LPEQRFADAGVMSIEHSDFDGTERLALVLDGDIVSTFDTPERVKLGSCAQKRKTGSCLPTSAREDTYSAVFGRTPLYSLSSSPLYSRGALNTLHNIVFPP